MKDTEQLKSRHLGHAIENNIKKRWPHVQLIVHVRQNYFLSRLPQEIRQQVRPRLLHSLDHVQPSHRLPRST